jgi:hypothetical protein
MSNYNNQCTETVYINELIVNESETVNEVVINDTISNTQIIIDDVNPNLNAIYTVLSSFQNSYTNLLLLTSKWQETAEEMDNYIQPLTAKAVETAYEMDTLQIAATGNWQGVYEYIDRGVVDAGFF